MTLEFRVVGVAIPKGSTKAFGYYEAPEPARRIRRGRQPAVQAGEELRPGVAAEH